MLLKKLAFIFLVLLLKQTGAQSYNFKNYSVENGLPFIQIFSIYQDDRGYLWSTGYGGLSKFDGKEFINYSPKQGLANHYCNAISSCGKGNLWIATKSGLNEFINEKEFKTYTVANGLPSDNISSLATNKADRLFVGTDKGLCYVKDNKFITIKELQGSGVTCLVFNADVGLLIGTNKGFYIMNGEKPVKIELPEMNQNINCVTYQRSSGIWIGTTNGLVQLHPETKKHIVYGITNGLIDENIASLTADYNNSIWVGTHSGLMKFNGKQFAYYKISSDQNSNNILCSYLDYEENIWFGTHAGLFKFRDEGFVSYGPHDGLTGTMVFPIARDSKNVLWIGTEQQGLFKYENNIFEQIKSKGHIMGDSINCFLPEKNRFLVGSNNGMVSVTDGKISLIKNLPRNMVYKIAKDSKGKYWIGALGAIYVCTINEKLVAENIVTLKMPCNDNDYQVWGIEEDNFGNMWIGAYLCGLYKYNGMAFEHLDRTLKIKTDDVFTLAKSKSGIIYAGSLEGLYIIDPATNKVKHISEENGLSSNLIYSLLLTNNDNTLWIGTNQGANKLDLFDLAQTGNVSISTYSKADGFKGVECNVGMWADKDGIVWFSTVNGLLRYNPSLFSQNDKEARLSITGIKLFYKDTLLADSSTLTYDLNNITFQYNGICLSNPDKVRYIHKLEGFDRYWSPETKENVTLYSNIPPGNYVFKVRSCNNEGVWNEGVEFSFSISRPYYQTWWFILSVVGLVVSGIAILFRLRLNQLRKEQRKETEKQVEISKNQLKALRSQMNPHFMFNSLNSIQNYIVNNKDDRAVMYLNKFAKLMRMILNNSEKSNVTLKEELDAMKLYIELEQMRFQNRFQYKITVSEEIDAEFEEIPTMLIQPYVENAILHGLNPKPGNDGLLQIDIRLAAGVMICSIVDNGIGRERSGAIKGASAKEHKSMGMDITKQRLQILNSVSDSNLSVRINDLRDEKGLPLGTKVDIFIPIT
ncbi:MAG: histidine kinase [Bacteroidota bacterium]|nr:histidine kinase [Bacteroidota bacterium]